MKQIGPLLTILLIGFLIGMPASIKSRRKLRLYWDRSCAGREWRSAFPEADKQDIRQYLQLFVDAFAFRDSRRLCFRPTDKLMEVYQALYPVKGWPDSLELETFAMMVEKTYHLDLTKAWTPEMTLGDIFRMIKCQPCDPSNPHSPSAQGADGR
jgi:hypothetical protein